tara:strand:- start:168 stop:491 length:324 start_codon:yes stop_codon:yes gene_type:complete
MNYLKIFSLFIILIFFSSCGTVKKAFTNQKKNSSDEFLVEKKSPLVMPPDYNELPIPKVNDDKPKSENTKIKSLISNNQETEDSSIKNNSDGNQNLDENILNKIKKN